MRMCNFQAQNGPLALNKKFPVKTINITFIYQLAPFIVHNLKKIFLKQIQSYEDAIFGPKMVHLPHPITPFTPIYPKMVHLTPFIAQNSKKFWMWIQTYEYVLFLHPKWPICPNMIFFRKTLNKPCSFHFPYCPSTFQKPKSLNINLLMKYWWLKNTEISLAESHFWP